jgi:hypothetical protein
MSKTASPPVLWSQEWAYEKAAQAIHYLAQTYPECGGLEALDPYHDAPFTRRPLRRTRALMRRL